MTESAITDVTGGGGGIGGGGGGEGGKEGGGGGGGGGGREVGGRQLSGWGDGTPGLGVRNGLVASD